MHTTRCSVPRPSKQHLKQFQLAEQTVVRSDPHSGPRGMCAPAVISKAAQQAPLSRSPHLELFFYFFSMVLRVHHLAAYYHMLRGCTVIALQMLTPAHAKMYTTRHKLHVEHAMATHTTTLV